MTEPNPFTWLTAAALDEDLQQVSANLTDAIKRVGAAADWLTEHRAQLEDPAALQRLDVVVSEFRLAVGAVIEGSLHLDPWIGTKTKLGVRTFGL